MSNSFQSIQLVVILLVVIQSLISADTIPYICDSYSATDTDYATLSYSTCVDPTSYYNTAQTEYYVVDGCGTCSGNQYIELWATYQNGLNQPFLAASFQGGCNDGSGCAYYKYDMNSGFGIKFSIHEGCVSNEQCSSSGVILQQINAVNDDDQDDDDDDYRNNNYYTTDDDININSFGEFDTMQTCYAIIFGIIYVVLIICAYFFLMKSEATVLLTESSSSSSSSPVTTSSVSIPVNFSNSKTISCVLVLIQLSALCAIFLFFELLFTFNSSAGTYILYFMLFILSLLTGVMSLYGTYLSYTESSTKLFTSPKFISYSVAIIHFSFSFIFTYYTYRWNYTSSNASLIIISLCSIFLFGRHLKVMFSTPVAENKITFFNSKSVLSVVIHLQAFLIIIGNSFTQDAGWMMLAYVLLIVSFASLYYSFQEISSGIETASSFFHLISEFLFNLFILIMQGHTVDESNMYGYLLLMMMTSPLILMLRLIFQMYVLLTTPKAVITITKRDNDGKEIGLTQQQQQINKV